MPMVLLDDRSTWPDDDLVAVTSEIDIESTIGGYLVGLFPMPLGRHIGWWSPMRRAIFALDGLRVTRSMKQAAKRYVTTVDADFPAVIRRCARPDRPGAWIDKRIESLYLRLHQMGIAHSVETWNTDGELVGGLYGVALGSFFAGESMFHDSVKGRDASKVALMRLVEVLNDAGVMLFDVQWLTPHLASLGAFEIERPLYLNYLDEALAKLPQQ